ncbi:hypothetical protein FKP32DRAFT_591801 [Trametes sanguinea]|nr:hypothetical protein FKP32DRAFT_591801 [Trametes sanguinea]
MDAYLRTSRAADLNHLSCIDCPFNLVRMQSGRRLSPYVLDRVHQPQQGKLFVRWAKYALIGWPAGNATTTDADEHLFYAQQDVSARYRKGSDRLHTGNARRRKKEKITAFEADECDRPGIRSTQGPRGPKGARGGGEEREEGSWRGGQGGGDQARRRSGTATGGRGRVTRTCSRRHGGCNEEMGGRCRRRGRRGAFRVRRRPARDWKAPESVIRPWPYCTRVSQKDRPRREVPALVRLGSRGRARGRVARKRRICSEEG